ncbi:MAG: carotenoid oxygenase family protein, partial [Thiotrichaceae bacterium]|nr:carotenoid oxygenase family protein [Thiotrichaceae bacterium]
MNTLNHNLKQTHRFKTLRVEGQIPDSLRGTLYRTGPGLVERFGKNNHPFLADGAITAIRIEEQAKGACNIIKTNKFMEEEKAQQSLYDMNAPFHRRLYNGLTHTVKNTGNTNILAWNNKLFALMEQGKPVEFNRTDLETIGTNNLGIIQGSFSAHPHRVDSLKTTFNFGINGRDIEVFALHDNGKINIISRFKAPWAGIIHDFMVTEKHIIFFIDPAKLVIWRAMLGLKDFTKYFHWDEKESTQIVVIPLNDPEKHTILEVDSCRVWHFANAYEEGNTIVVDAFKHKNIDVLIKPTELDSDIPAPELCRFILSMKDKTVTEENMPISIAEFPIVNPSYMGKKHRYIWTQTYSDKSGNEGFSRYDTKAQEQKRWFAPNNHLVSEAIFVPEN